VVVGNESDVVWIRPAALEHRVDEICRIPVCYPMEFVGSLRAHQESDKFINTMLERGRPNPNHIRFVTYTTRYNECEWLKIDELEKHYSRAEVDAVKTDKGITIKTKNIARLTLTTASAAEIDGQPVPSAASFGEKRQPMERRRKIKRGLRKQHGLQGPIDDAFMDAFLVVNPPKQFAAEYDKWMRADLRTKEATKVNKQDIAEKQPGSLR